MIYNSQMKKARSTHQNGIVDHYFAVYPLEMIFDKEHRTRIVLYFEKNLQILSRHEVLTNSSSKQQAHIFECPSHIQHFRMQTEKNMDYQWSLYFPKMEEGGETQEFVEGQKVNFKHGWTDYHTKKIIYHEMHFNFTSIKCRFEFLLTIANNMKDLLTNVQKYFREKRPLKIQRNVAAVALEMIGLKPPEQIKEENQESEDVQIVEEIKQNAQLIPTKDVEANRSTHPQSTKQEKQQVDLFSHILFRHSREQEQEQIVQNPRSQKIQESKVVINEVVSPKAEEEIELTRQEKEFGDQLQTKIKSMDTEICSFMKMITSDPKIENQEPKIDKSFEEIQKQVNTKVSIGRTVSQTIDQKGQVYLPIYRQNKYIALFFGLIAFICILIIVQTRSSSPLQFENIQQTNQQNDEQISQIFMTNSQQKPESQTEQFQSDIFRSDSHKEMSINQAAELNQSDQPLADSAQDQPISSVDTLQARLLKTKTKKTSKKGYSGKRKAKTSKRRK